MKKLLILLTLMFLMGCVTVEVPKYLDEEFQYKKTFNAGFNETFSATVESLKNLGWKIAGTEGATVAKTATSEENLSGFTALIFTEIKQRSMFLASSYLTLNAYVRSIEGGKSEVELRYLSITVIPPFFNQVRVDKNDGLAEKIYRKIEANLNK